MVRESKLNPENTLNAPPQAPEGDQTRVQDTPKENQFQNESNDAPPVREDETPPEREQETGEPDNEEVPEADQMQRERGEDPNRTEMGLNREQGRGAKDERDAHITLEKQIGNRDRANLDRPAELRLPNEYGDMLARRDTDWVRDVVEGPREQRTAPETDWVKEVMQEGKEGPKYPSAAFIDTIDDRLGMVPLPEVDWAKEAIRQQEEGQEAPPATFVDPSDDRLRDSSPPEGQPKKVGTRGGEGERAERGAFDGFD